MRLWSLPGPSHFLDQAVAALRDGCSLLLPVPAHGLNGLRKALEDRLHFDGWNVAPVVEDDGGDPVEQMFSALGLDDGNQRRTVALLRQRLDPGQVVLVDRVLPCSWSAWKQFIGEYEIASRSIGMCERPLIVLFTEGVALLEMPQTAVALRALAWNNVVGELDVLLFVTSLLRNGTRPGYELRLVGRMISRLALWDLAVAAYLIERNPEDLFHPAVVLNDALRELGMPAGLDRTWQSGGLQCFDDVQCAHPFLIVREGDAQQELTMRLWAAQATEVLPALELQRRNLVRLMRGLVATPIDVAGIRYCDLNDMEIGPLSYVAHRQGLSDNIQRTAEKLKRLRNKLAHLDALDAIDVFDEKLYQHSTTDD
ncbi:hypothetical protein Veis_1818 [Verminephrobacter eiseniae EF01-2]|uniref:Uncharacterized protein n=1 Tax=Verminephrobacter eiseniae (strain EF01-2) TaxID=391735 RepID=A1WIW4_VEREI|nr:hypothetical protein Veis_1818 [Verminephrobacter eiseniae EF01-2]MCW5283192.1 hypothetical protein [Verminephrobacter eiseniae]MCW5303508.1 hypothetical protein [Verminephrobacter eiseniae]MCW8180495.1 hypothetical protein [Verminephrobacter eiseniae]MCW8188302.1 hypothetical protein [Verminephrobacter eiseniae]